uniref:YfhO family protein n=1 Tax=Ndongobacter massiliensis TaxID=1871025 RepID=UPI0009312BB1|nr:YfhO family protein [Ndongobacter massiliensis]
MKYDLTQVAAGRDVLALRRKGQKKRTFGLVFLSFLLPIVALLPGFAYAGIAPFGTNTTMAVDLRHEYVGFYEAYRYALAQPSGFFYSMTKSLGGEMIGTFSYYMASPLHLLFFLFPREALPAIIEIVQLLKIGLAGASFSLLLIHREHGEDWRVVLFSTLYGLLSFATANLLNHMWLDPILLFPLVILALENLLREKNPLPYVLVLALSIFTNYYIAYMGCIFLALYAIYALVRMPRDPKMEHGHWFIQQIKRYLRFIFYSVLAAGICAFVLLPTLQSILASKGTYAENVVAGWVLDYPLADFFAKLLPAAFNYDQVPSGLPNVFCGTVTLLFSILYFMNGRIALRERFVSFAILVFLFLSMNVKNLTIFWHGMQYPIWYEYRFSWLFSFFSLLLAYRSMRRTPRPALVFYLIATILYAGLLVYLWRNLTRYPFLTHYHILAGAAVWVIVSLLLFLRPVRNRAVAVLLLLVCFLEMSTNAAFHTGCYSYESWAEFLLMEKQVGEPLRKISPSTDEFWRTEKTFMHDNNDGMRFCSPTITHFNSTLERENVDLFASLGFATTQNSINGTNGTKITDAIFGVRYYLEGNPNAFKLQAPGIDRLKPKSHRPDLSSMTLLEETPYVRSYENKQAMPLGLLAEADIATLLSNHANPADYQDRLLNVLDGASGEVNYLERLPLDGVTLENCTETGAKSLQDEPTTYQKTDEQKPARISFTFTVKDSAAHYLSVSNLLNSKNSKLLLDGEELSNKRVGSHRNSQLYNVANGEAGGEQHTFTVEMKDTSSLIISNISLFRLDEPGLEKASAFQQKNGLRLTKRRDTEIEGSVSATKDTPYLLLTLPYSSGWSATVDGAPVATKKVLGQLLVLPITPGEHDIQLTYSLPGFEAGKIVSIGTLTLALMLGITHAVIQRRRRKEEGEIA